MAETVRPNPIAAADLKILAGRRETEVDAIVLYCLDGTPLLDVKHLRI